MVNLTRIGKDLEIINEYYHDELDEENHELRMSLIRELSYPTDLTRFKERLQVYQERLEYMAKKVADIRKNIDEDIDKSVFEIRR